VVDLEYLKNLSNSYLENKVKKTYKLIDYYPDLTFKPNILVYDNKNKKEDSENNIDKVVGEDNRRVSTNASERLYGEAEERIKRNMDFEQLIDNNCTFEPNRGMKELRKKFYEENIKKEKEEKRKKRKKEKEEIDKIEEDDSVSSSEECDNNIGEGDVFDRLNIDSRTRINKSNRNEITTFDKKYSREDNFVSSELYTDTSTVPIPRDCLSPSTIAKNDIDIDDYYFENLENVTQCSLKLPSSYIKQLSIKLHVESDELKNRRSDSIESQNRSSSKDHYKKLTSKNSDLIMENKLKERLKKLFIVLRYEVMKDLKNKSNTTKFSEFDENREENRKEDLNITSFNRYLLYIY
jgi:hypothetical protein